MSAPITACALDDVGEIVAEIRQLSTALEVILACRTTRSSGGKTAHGGLGKASHRWLKGILVEIVIMLKLAPGPRRRVALDHDWEKELPVFAVAGLQHAAHPAADRGQ